MKVWRKHAIHIFLGHLKQLLKKIGKMKPTTHWPSCILPINKITYTNIYLVHLYQIKLLSTISQEKIAYITRLEMSVIIYIAAIHQDIWIGKYISHMWDEALQSLDFPIDDVVN